MRQSSLETRHGPDLDRCITSRASNLGRAPDPGDAIHSILVRIQRLHPTRRLLQAPHVDVCIQGTADGVGASIVPSYARNTRCVCGPSVGCHTPVGGLECKDFALGVARREMAAVLGECEARDNSWGDDWLGDLCSGERVQGPGLKR